MITTEIQQARTTQRWSVDASRSEVDFAVKTFWGLFTVHGRFDRFDGWYELSRDGAELELTIEADSLDTGNGTRDRHLRSADFFHVDRHPRVRFTSTDILDLGGGQLRIAGSLEAAGRSEVLTFTASVREPGDELEIEATTTVDQRRLGMSHNPLGMLRPPATLHVRARLAAHPD